MNKMVENMLASFIQANTSGSQLGKGKLDPFS